MHHEHDHCDDQNKMNERACDMENGESKQPKNDQNYGDGKQHRTSPSARPRGTNFSLTAPPTQIGRRRWRCWPDRKSKTTNPFRCFNFSPEVNPAEYHAENHGRRPNGPRRGARRDAECRGNAAQIVRSV
jgi:hypothetical protein